MFPRQRTAKIVTEGVAAASNQFCNVFSTTKLSRMPACAKSICIQEIPILSSSLLDTQQASARKAQAPDAGKQRRRDGRSADESRPFCTNSLPSL